MIELAAIEAARDRIAGTAIRTPLVRLPVDDAPAEIYLKLENLQPINSFKIRGATSAVLLAEPGERAKGLVTASAGNMAQGVAYVARALGLPATVLVPDSAPQAKLAAIERLGGTVRKVPYDQWWNVMVTGKAEGLDGLFVHPVQDPAVMAGNGTIGLEILEDLPDPDVGGHPVRRRRADHRHRQRGQGAATADRHRDRRAGQRGRAGRRDGGRRTSRRRLQPVLR